MKWTLEEYWQQVVYDYLSCLSEDTSHITDEQVKKIAANVLSDSAVWDAIYESVDYHLAKA